ncbi:hypothetical protein ABK040_012238 [Willaertia magna]
MMQQLASGNSDKTQDISSSSISTTIDKEQFIKKIKVLGIKVPSKKISPLMAKLKKNVLDRKKIKFIEDIPNDSENKIILLNEKFESLDNLPEEIKQILKENEITESSFHEVTLTYDCLSTTEVLSTILPVGSEIPSSFEQVGHIAHLNISDDLYPYRFIIGQVILDKNPKTKTVVNKLGMIDSLFREFKMEILCGEDNFDVSVKENGITFKFNYREVYWNSRLGTEHTRLLQYFNKDQIVCDMMAGVGPFAIPAAVKVGCRVLANDLNPKSYEYMKENVKINKVKDLVECFNMDGREFIKHVVNERKIEFHHVIMNLPASAVEFLDIFRLDQLPIDFQPIIHVYTFVKGSRKDEAGLIELAKQQVEDVVGKDHVESYVNIHNVRNVAPTKEMFCISFRLRQPNQSPNKRKIEEENSNLNTTTPSDNDKKLKL